MNKSENKITASGNIERTVDHTEALTEPVPGRFNTGRYWVSIGISNVPGGYKTVLLWRMLTHVMVVKWLWYFNYRASLLKVQSPRKCVCVRSGFEDSIRPEETAIIRLTNIIRSRKAKITEVQNKMNRFRQNWNSLFPLLEDIEWKRLELLLSKKKANLLIAESEYNSAKCILENNKGNDIQ